MSRLIDTWDLHNTVKKRKSGYGRLANLVDEIVEEMVAVTDTAQAISSDELAKVFDEIIREMTQQSQIFRYDAKRTDLSAAIDICIGIVEKEYEKIKKVED